MLSYLYHFLKSEEGPTAVEYSIMLALIVGVIFGSVSFIGALTSEGFHHANAELERTFPDMSK